MFHKNLVTQQVFFTFLNEPYLADLSLLSGRCNCRPPCVSCTRTLAFHWNPSLPYRVFLQFPESSHREAACFLDHLTTPAPNVAPVQACHCSSPCLRLSLQVQISQSQASPVMLVTTLHLSLQPLSAHSIASTFSISGHSGFL